MAGTVSSERANREADPGAPRRMLCAVLVVVVVVGLAAPGCSDGKSHAASGPVITLSRRSVPADEAVDIAVEGVRPGAMVQVELTLERSDGTYASQAVFRADSGGGVKLRTTAPVEGDYQGVDAMGLFWSSRRQAGPPASNLPAWTDRAHLAASVGGRQVARTELERRYLAPGGRVTEVRERGLVGTFFQPAGDGRRPAVVVVGGSEGGMSFSQLQAALLSSHGYAALALAYFDPGGSLGGLPRTLSLIPLEYVNTAIDWLSGQPGVDPARLGMKGASRGAELALLVASRNPKLKAVVAAAPSSAVWTGFGTIGVAAWTEGGRPVPFLVPHVGPPPSLDWWRAALADPAAALPALISVSRINGPLLLLSGSDDQLWPSGQMAEQIMTTLRDSHHPYPDQHLVFPDAGHAVSGVPYEPTADFIDVPGVAALGGTPEATTRAWHDSWAAVLQFLDATLGA